MLVHDQTHAEPALAFALSRVTQATHGGTPVGIFRNVERPVYDDLMAEQLRGGRGEAREGRPRRAPPLRRDLGRRLAGYSQPTSSPVSSFRQKVISGSLVATCAISGPIVSCSAAKNVLEALRHPATRRRP